jgi:hypothetical protein
MISEVKSWREINSFEGSRKAVISFWLKLFFRVNGGNVSPNLTGEHSLLQTKDVVIKGIRKKREIKIKSLFTIITR